MSQVSLDNVAQTLARTVDQEVTDELFEKDPTPIVQDDREGLLRMSRLSSLKMRAIMLRRKSKGRLRTEHLQLTSLSFCNFYFYFIIEIMLKTMVV